MSPLGAAITAEARKLRTTRLWWILLLCVALLGGGYALVPAITALLADRLNGQATGFDDPATVRAIYNGGNTLTRIFAMVLGLLAMGAEYRYGTLAGTYLATPRRGRVVVAKALTVFAAGLLYGVVSVLCGVAVAVPFVLVAHASFHLASPLTWRSLVLGVVAIGLWTMIGLGVGVLIRSTLVAMLVGIGFAYLIEPSLTAVFFLQHWEVALNLMPSGATNAMLGITNPILFASQDPSPWWQGALVLAGWCLLPALAGALSTLRRDVT